MIDGSHPLRRPIRGLTLLAGLGLADRAAAQTLGRGVETAIDLPRVLASLVLCLLLAGLAGWFLRRRQRGVPPLGRPGSAQSGLNLAGLNLAGLGAAWFRPAAGTRIQLVERMRLTPALEVCLISCDGREVLLAATPSGGFLISPPAPGEAP